MSKQLTIRPLVRGPQCGIKTVLILLLHAAKIFPYVIYLFTLSASETLHIGNDSLLRNRQINFFLKFFVTKSRCVTFINENEMAASIGPIFSGFGII